ncbi:oxidoreductase [Leucobacter sp. Psy1]|uniref:Gfo/Idh/MocA family protein n=1 Tax=Leucobacter sp. Psy1 TaxID=2875729 RepID=UPI001CD3A476|nr:Gfo/Idh/MocA family oxidoreductase [Leucobacter sp. Psy1]UBH07169.1 oxidoreductase [Leucobacter sp. Psy1]
MNVSTTGPSQILRVGIVGCGKIAINHAKALNAIPEVALAAVCDVDQTRAEAFAEAFGASRAYSDLEEMLASGLDAVMICTPHPIHEQGVLAAARHGLHVLCEKPIAVSIEEADRMVAATEAAGVKFGVVFQRRFWPAAQRVRDALAAGKLGTPAVGSLTVRLGRDAEYYSEPWRGRWDTEGGGVLINQGVHYVDMLLWLMGEPTRVYGTTRTVKHGAYIEVEDTAVAVIEFSSGAVATLQAGTTFAPGLGTSVFISDARGRAVTVTEHPEGAPGINDIWTIPGETDYQSYLATDIEADPPLASIHEGLAPFHAEQIEEFVQAVAQDRDPLVTGADALRALEVILAVYESSRSGEAVDLAEWRMSRAGG